MLQASTSGYRVVFKKSISWSFSSLIKVDYHSSEKLCTQCYLKFYQGNEKRIWNDICRIHAKSQIFLFKVLFDELDALRKAWI